MNNKEIAYRFFELADLLEIKGDENPFRIVGIRKAARAIESLADPVEVLLKTGKLKSLPHIGKGSVEKIEELLTTGKLKETEELLSEIPQTLLDLLKIPEVGPKTVQTLWKTLRINTVSQLEEAVRQQKLRALKGFGEKTEQNILRGIELYRRGQNRFLLGFVYPLAQEFVSVLREVPGVKEVACAGSLRRMRETIGDVDILVAAEEAEPVMKAFVELPSVKEVLALGKTKSSIRTELDLQVDLRVVPEESFGAALQYFTGSKEHNVALRSLAKERHLKINEYGVFDEKGKKLAGEREEEIYEILGLEFIPPELRENRGEIETAQKRKLPPLLEMKNLRGDFHIHTNYTDGQFSIEEMAEAALKMGYEIIAITDHSQAVRVAHGLNEERLKEQKKEIEKVREKYRKKGLEILHGLELDILPDGSLDLEKDVLAELDFVIGSVHSRFRQSEQEMTARILRAMASGLVDCIGHPTGRMLQAREAYAVNMDALIQGALKYDVALEINASYERLDLNDIYARKAKEMGAKLMINSDAHHFAHFHNILYGVSVARRGWLEKGDVLNSLSADEFKKWIKRRREG